MRSVRPPPKVVPPRPPPHLSESALQMEQRVSDRDLPYFGRDVPSPREYTNGLTTTHAPQRSFVAHSQFSPSQGPPQRTLLAEPGKNVSHPAHQDFSVRQTNFPSVRSEFDRDVAEQMRLLEEDMLKIMIERGELPATSSISGPPKTNFDAVKNDDNLRNRAVTDSKYSSANLYHDHEQILDRRRDQSSTTVDAGISPRQNYVEMSRGNPSPARRKGGAIGSLYETEDHLRLKAEKQALYSQQLQQQMKEKSFYLPAESERRILVDNRNQRIREESGPNGLAIGLDKNRELELRRQRQQEYKMQLDQQVIRKPIDSHSSNSFNLGLSKDEEIAMRRQKQLQYKQQLDEQVPTLPFKPTRQFVEEQTIARPAVGVQNNPFPFDNPRSSDEQAHLGISPRFGYSSDRDSGRRAEEYNYVDNGKVKTPSKSITNPLSIEEKENKRFRQDDYRKQLDAQKKERERQKDEEKKKIAEEDRRFMSQFETGKIPKGYPAEVHLSPSQKSQRTYPPSERNQPNPRGVSVVDHPPQVDKYDYSYDNSLKSRQHPPREFDGKYDIRTNLENDGPFNLARSSVGNDNFEGDTDHRYFNEDVPYDHNVNKYGRYDKSNSGLDPSEQAVVSVTSPSKSPKPARNQLVQDIYGRNSILSHHDDNIRDGWKPSGKNNNDRQRAAIHDQKAALDRQKAENQRLKDEEKQKQKEEDEKLERKIRAEIQAEEEKTRLEKEKKQKIAHDNQREIEDLQHKKEREAFARRGLSDKEQARPPAGAEKGNFVTYDHIQSPLKELVSDLERTKATAYHDSPVTKTHFSPPRAGQQKTDAIDNFVRTYEQKKPFIESPKRDSLEYARTLSPADNGRDERDYRQNAVSHPPRSNSPRDYPPYDHYQSRDYQFGKYHQEREYVRGVPPQGNPNRQYSNHDRDQPMRDYYPPVHDSQDRYDQQVTLPMNNIGSNINSQHRGNVDFQRKVPQGNNGWRNYEEDSMPRNDAEVSFVSESRFVPANPWSSDIVSSLLPLHTVPDHIRKAKGELSYVPQYSSEVDHSVRSKVQAKGTVDLEQSLASDSLLVYVGPKTPNPNVRNPRVESSVHASPPSRTTVVNKEAISVEGSGIDTGLNHLKSGRSKTPERLDPASLPVAGRPTSRQDGVAVRRVIAQPIVPTADEVPNNRIFVSKAQNNSQLHHHKSPPQKNPSHRYQEQLDTYFAADEVPAIDLTDPSLEHKEDDPSNKRRLQNVISANSALMFANLNHRVPNNLSKPLDIEIDGQETNSKYDGSRPVSSNGQILSKRGWDTSSESRHEIIKQLSHNLVYEPSTGDDGDYDDSFESERG